MNVFLFLFFALPLNAGTIIAKDSSACIDKNGAPKKGSHCLCYTGRTSCADGIGTCAEQRCEQRSCEKDADCAQFSAKCIEHFCEVPAAEETIVPRPGALCGRPGAKAKGKFLDSHAGPGTAVDRDVDLLCRDGHWILPFAP